jgi:hypothetical protein
VVAAVVLLLVATAMGAVLFRADLQSADVGCSGSNAELAISLLQLVHESSALLQWTLGSAHKQHTQ